MIKSHEFNLSISTNSNSNLDFDQHDTHDPSAIRFIDSLDENNNSNNNISNNNKRQCMNSLTTENSLPNSRSSHLFPPVKFVTHFSNIKEDEDKT